MSCGNKLVTFYKLLQDMACQYESGLDSCPVTVSAFGAPPPAAAAAEPALSAREAESKRKWDYESLADMEKRRKNERAREMARILRNDGLSD